jgi:predicted O-linked N-acetylglucosamine transferase (SPINDLY family)
VFVFARRAAPVQVTYLGYPNTTGLATMDYRITDAESDPPGMTESHYTETLVRLPSGFLCYAPPASAPEPHPAYADNNLVTFGSFNNLSKLTSCMIELWARILREVPRSRLLLKAQGLADDETGSDIRTLFVAHGIDGNRIELLGPKPSFQEHLLMYQRIDIALDTFPYHGTTTTCEALWMGVPVITLAGRAHVSRVGVSLLSSVRCEELIAASEEDYVGRAVELARQPARRRMLHSSMRHMVQESPLVNVAGFVTKLEAAYQRMWKERSVGVEELDLASAYA